MWKGSGVFSLGLCVNGLTELVSEVVCTQTQSSPPHSAWARFPGDSINGNNHNRGMVVKKADSAEGTDKAWILGISRRKNIHLFRSLNAARLEKLESI